MGSGPVGKTADVGAKARATKKVAEKAVKAADQETSRGFVSETAELDATLCTAETIACEGMNRDHAAVKHSFREHLRAVGASQRREVVLVDAQARVLCHGSQDAPEPGPLLERIACYPNALP